MLGHLSFGVSDLDRAITFYDAALAPLGLARVWTKGDAAGYGPPGGGDLLAFKRRSVTAVPPLGQASIWRSTRRRTPRLTPSTRQLWLLAESTMALPVCALTMVQLIMQLS